LPGKTITTYTTTTNTITITTTATSHILTLLTAASNSQLLPALQHHNTYTQLQPLQHYS